jgi:hypothetical protein
VHSFLEHSFVARIIDSLGAGTLTHTAWQSTSPTSHAAMHDAIDEVESAAELVLELAAVVVLLPSL